MSQPQGWQLLWPGTVPSAATAQPRYPATIHCFANYVDANGKNTFVTQEFQTQKCPSNETVNAVCALIVKGQQPDGSKEQSFASSCK